VAGTGGQKRIATGAIESISNCDDWISFTVVHVQNVKRWFPMAARYEVMRRFDRPNTAMTTIGTIPKRSGEILNSAGQPCAGTHERELLKSR
jgi:hypothetical protein